MSERYSASRVAGTSDLSGAEEVWVLSDADLASRLRGGQRAASDRAAEVLTQRHEAAATRYAELFTTGASSAAQLVDEASTMALTGLRLGADLNRPVRLQLLANVHHVALSWAKGPQRYRLVPEFADFADALRARKAQYPRPVEPDSLRGAFARLSRYRQTAVWHHIVECDSLPAVALVAGVNEETIPTLIAKALADLRAMLLADRVGAGADCPGYEGILAAVTRPGATRTSPELELHASSCQFCADKWQVLRTLESDPQTVLAEQILPWGGPGYGACSHPRRTERDRTQLSPEPHLTTRTAVFAVHGVRAAPTPDTGGRARHAGTARLSFKSSLLTLAALGVFGVVGPCTILALETDARPTSKESTVRSSSPMPPPGAISGSGSSGSHTPVSPRSAHANAPQLSPAPTSQSLLAPFVSKGLPGPATRLVGQAYMPLVNAASGLCLDSGSASPTDGTALVMASCDGSATEQWALDPQSRLHLYADPGFCVGAQRQSSQLWLWHCATGSGHSFAIPLTPDPAGRMLWQQNITEAVTPAGSTPGSPVVLASPHQHADDSDQRWF